MRTGSRRNARIVSTYCIHSSPLFGFFGHQHIVWTYCNHSFALCGCWVTIEGLGAFQQFAKRGVYIQISNSLIWDHILYKFCYPTLDFTKAKLIKCRKPLLDDLQQTEGSLSALAKLIIWYNANKLWGVMFNSCLSQVAGSSGYEFGGTLCFLVACHRRLLELPTPTPFREASL